MKQTTNRAREGHQGAMVEAQVGVCRLEAPQHQGHHDCHLLLTVTPNLADNLRTLCNPVCVRGTDGVMREENIPDHRNPPGSEGEGQHSGARGPAPTPDDQHTWGFRHPSPGPREALAPPPWEVT